MAKKMMAKKMMNSSFGTERVDQQIVQNGKRRKKAQAVLPWLISRSRSEQEKQLYENLFVVTGDFPLLS